MDFDDIFADLNLPVGNKRCSYEVVPEAPVITDIPDLDSLFGAGDTLSELRLSQWLPAIQHSKRPSQEIYNHVRKHNMGNENSHQDMEPMMSERGDSQEIFLGSQFPVVKKVKTAKTNVHPIQTISPVERKQETPAAKKKFRMKTPQVKRVSPHNKENMDGCDFFQTAAALVLPSTTRRQGMCLRSVLEIPDPYRSIFKFQYFNIVQSKLLDDILYTDRSVVVCSPTGSGKTAIFEMAIIRLLTSAETKFNKSFKVVYMAPIKALCNERFQDWRQKFEPLGLKVMELTGDTDLEDFYLLQEVNIILTTPEKWDSMTRKWRDNKSVVQAICLFLVDEIHILNDETRGATVEAVISRMKTIQAARSRSSKKGDLHHDFRFVAASATLTNIEDIAAWLSTGKNPALHHKFDDNVRPVRLRKVVLGYNCSEKQSPFQFDISLNYRLAGIINTYSEGKPTLVFCSTRKSVTQGADILAKDIKSSYVRNGQHRQILQNLSFLLKDSKLRDLVVKGIGYHHAGMDFQDRKKIEESFSHGELSVLVATSTLAMGVNLPAHLVIIKSTMYYNMGCHEEYSDTQVLQMIGRAGRPQFDTSATAVIMTKTQTKVKYDNLINGTQLIESNLHKNLIEHLNAEIVLGTITDISVAVEWLKFTYLYIRVMKNPKYYGMPSGLTKNSMEKRLQDLCMKNLNQLLGLNLLHMNEDTLDVKPTDNGRLMARYCISYKTAELLNTITDEESVEDLLLVISKCEEFEDIKLRINEKKTLNTLNRDKNRVTVRYPLPGKMKTADMKVNCLIQAQLGCLLVQDFALQQDTSRIFRVGIRVTRCLVEFLSQKSHNHKSVLSALQLCKAFKARLWENSKFVSKQLEGIGPTLSTALVNSGLTTFEKIEQTNPREIELIVNRHPPFGNQVRDSVLNLPKYELVIEQIARYSETRAEIVISLQISNRDHLKEKQQTGHTCTLLVGNQDNRVVFKQRIMDSLLMKETNWTKKVEVYLASKGPELNIHYISQDWVGMDIECSYIPHYIGGVRISNSSKPVQDQALDRDKNQSKPRKRQVKNQTKSKEPKPKSTSSKAVANHINDMKARLSNFPTTPMLFKKPKLQFAVQDSRNTPVNLDRYAYTPQKQYGYISDKPTQPSQAYGDTYRDNHNQNGNNNADDDDDDNNEMFYAVPCDMPYLIDGRPTAGQSLLDESSECFNRPSSVTKKNDWAELDMYRKHREACRMEEAQQDYLDDDSLPDYDFNHGLQPSQMYGGHTDKSDCDQYTDPEGCEMVQETDYGFVYVGEGDQSHVIDWDDKVTQDINKASGKTGIRVEGNSSGALRDNAVRNSNTCTNVVPNSDNTDRDQGNFAVELADSIECYDSEEEKNHVNQKSKWASYFSSQSSTASDYLKSKHPTRQESNKIVMEDSRHCNMDEGQRAVNMYQGQRAVNMYQDQRALGNRGGFCYNKEVFRDDARPLYTTGLQQTVHNEQSHKFGQVFAWISNSQNKDLTPKQGDCSDFENWSDDDDDMINLCETSDTHTVSANNIGDVADMRRCQKELINHVTDDNSGLSSKDGTELHTKAEERSKSSIQSGARQQKDCNNKTSSRFFPTARTGSPDNDFTSIFDGLF